MSKQPDDEFVEKLLRGLPKSPPMSPLEVKRFEKQIDALVLAEKGDVGSKKWKRSLPIAASIITLIAGFAVFSGGNEVIGAKTPSVINTPSPGSDEKVPGIESPNPIPTSSSSSSGIPDEGRTVYGQSKSPTPAVGGKSVPVTDSGLDYSSNLVAAKEKILRTATKGDFKLLSSTQVSCSVQLGVDKSLWAIDSGTYDGEFIDAYYFGSSSSSLSIKIVGFGCKLISEI